MNTDVPYLPSTGNLHPILDSIQNAGVPEVFNKDFLRDLGYASSNDRPVVKILKYLGMLDDSGRPQTSYRDFVDHTKAKRVLAVRLATAFDDLFISDKLAHEKTASALKGWFKSKTGTSDSVSDKIAKTFKSLVQYADFAEIDVHNPTGMSAAPPEPAPPPEPKEPSPAPSPQASLTMGGGTTALGLVYRIEVHLPDTQNVDTFRAIFRALREEIMT